MPSKPKQNKNVHLIFDCDDTLVNAHQLINALMDSDKNAQAVLSPSLLNLCCDLIYQERLHSITINTHQDLGTITQRITGMDGMIDAERLAKSVSWNIAENLKAAIHERTGHAIDIQICLQSDIYPPLSTSEESVPHKLGDTAALIKTTLNAQPAQSTNDLADRIGEIQYRLSGLAESEKATQTAFVLQHIKTLQPEGTCHIIYVDDTKANLERKNLPTRAWINQQIKNDEHELAKARQALVVLEEESKDRLSLTFRINTLRNRLQILKHAPAIDDPNIHFAACHFRHELERAKAGDPPKDQFHLLDASDKVTCLNGAALIRLTQDAQPKSKSKSLNDVYHKYFNKKQGIFYRYLIEREKTYAWRDYWSTMAACLFGCFGYQTEREKRRNFINTLNTLMSQDPIDTHHVLETIQMHSHVFSPRATESSKLYKHSLRHCLLRFQGELRPFVLSKSESALAEPSKSN